MNRDVHRLYAMIARGLRASGVVLYTGTVPPGLVFTRARRVIVFRLEWVPVDYSRAIARLDRTNCQTRSTRDA